MTVLTLLDMAREKVGSDAELARRIDLTRQNVADMRAGRRTISPETVAALCDVLELPGDEARQWLALAVIENPKNSSRAEMLKRALFASWVLGVGALTQGQNDAQAAQTVVKLIRAGGGGSDAGYKVHTDGLHIVAHPIRWLTRAVRRFLRAARIDHASLTA